jgi:hypothetical protein
MGTSINIYLPSGNPDGPWEVRRDNWVGKIVFGSWSEFPQYRERLGHRRGVYVLKGDDPTEAQDSLIYVGKATDVARRITQHFQETEDSWTNVAVILSVDDFLDEYVISYLESSLLSSALESKRSAVKNKQAPPLPSGEEDRTSQAKNFLLNVMLLLPVMAIHSFESIPEASENEHRAGALLYLSGKGVQATGRQLGDGFVVYSGSFAVSDIVTSMGTGAISRRSSLVKSGKLIPSGTKLEFVENVIFTSPSLAADVILGNSSNGRSLWRDESGKSLRELEEVQLNSATY